MNKFKTFKHLVVFDGTSAYIIPSSELDYEIEQNDAAQNYSDIANEEISS